jgi:hypothetical protein
MIEWTYDSRLIDGAQEWFALPCPPLLQGRQRCMGAVFEQGKTENFIRTPDLGVQNANLQAY